MNLYLLSQRENNDYDTYDSAVVAAESEEDAKTIHPSNNRWESWCWASSPDKVTATLIGTAFPGTARGVILASFNAG